MTDAPESSTALLRENRVRLFCFLVFLASLVATTCALFFASDIAISDLALLLLLFFTLIFTLIPLRCSLPNQNIFTIALLTAILPATAQIIISRTHIPFGESNWTDDFGPQLFRSVPLPMLFIWIVAILNSRGAARSLLRPWSGIPNHGLFVIGFTSLLNGIFFLGFGHFAEVMRFCAPAHPHFYLWFQFLGNMIIGMMVLLAIAPWLVKKKPGPSPSPDIYPLLVWLLSLGFFMLPH